MLDEKDLQAIAALISASEARMTEKINEVRTGLHQEISATRAELHNEIKDTRTELHQEISATRTELNAKIDDTRTDLHQEISDVRTELNAKIDDTRTGVKAYIEAAVLPKLSLLAEGHQTLLEILAPKDRVDALEDEVKFLKIVIRQMGDDLQTLKKAN